MAMPDREKVIKGLEELYGFLFREYANIPAEESKIYYERTCAIRDAIAQLKEQESRLLSYDEISNHDCVYMEFYGKKDIYPSLNYEARTWAKENYGKYWRVWSNKPTEEQRQAVKWE